MDEIEAQFVDNFGYMESSLKNMEIGLKWFWNKLIFPPLDILVIRPLTKLFNFLTGGSDGGETEFF